MYVLILRRLFYSLCVSVTCAFSCMNLLQHINITSFCMFSAPHNNTHFCFTTLLPSAFHSYWSRVFRPPVWWSRVFQSRVFSRPTGGSCTPAAPLAPPMDILFSFITRRIQHWNEKNAHKTNTHVIDRLTLLCWSGSGFISRGNGVPIVKVLKNALWTALRTIFRPKML